MSTKKINKHFGKNRPHIAPDLAVDVEKLKIVFNEKEKNEYVLLKSFTQKFAKNKIHFIIGNSGSGKTTLVTHFNGLLKSKYGSILIGDHAILGKDRKIRQFKKLRKTVGMVFQFPEYQLFKDTIEKDIMFGPQNLGVKKEIAKQRASKYLNLLGLDDSFLRRSPFGLSGGQKRRVAIAGILAIEPDILVFDEPTAGLDPAGEQEMIKIIANLKEDGKTVFVITHVMDQALELADQIHVLNNHKLEVSGTPYEIFTNDDLLSRTSIDLPKVIRTIYELGKCDQSFLKILKMEPRTVEELAKCIYTNVGGK